MFIIVSYFGFGWSQTETLCPLGLSIILLFFCIAFKNESINDNNDNDIFDIPHTHTYATHSYRLPLLRVGLSNFPKPNEEKNQKKKTENKHKQNKS